MKKSVLVFFLLFFGTLGLLHFFAASYLTNGFHEYTRSIIAIYILGFFLMPMGYFVATRHPNTPFYFIAWLGYIWMGTFFISLWVSGLFALVETFWPDHNLHRVALMLIGILTAYSLFRGLQKPRVRVEPIKGPGTLKGLRFAQITDLHVGLLNHDQRWLKKVVDTINELRTDFIFLTGDLVEGKNEHVSPHLHPLAFAQARLGKIYVSGNHELIHGGLIWERELAAHGWRVLHNEHEIFNYEGHNILVAGVPDRMIGRFDGALESNPDKALSTTKNLEYKILLAHEPSSVFDLKSQKPDLILAGHTHGGQIFPFNFIVRMVQPVVKGWKTILGIPVFAHMGTGLWGPPMRLGTRNEIVLFEMV